MTLALSQAKVLGILYALKRTETTQVLADMSGLAESTTSAALRNLGWRGLVSSTDTVPTYYQITANGRSVISRPCYREYRDHPRLTARDDDQTSPAIGRGK